MSKAIHNFTAAYNENAAPFVWRKREVTRAAKVSRKLRRSTLRTTSVLADCAKGVNEKTFYARLAA